jgi:transglutaminase-like putative cysteine protease
MAGVRLRKIYFLLALLVPAVGPTCAAETPSSDQATPALEIVRQHIDVDVLANNTYTQLGDAAYKVLTEQGRAAMQQVKLSYTEGYQSLVVRSAYTQKADGRRIDVDQNSILYGHGASSQPGYEDTRNVTVVFPDLEVGDQVVLVTLFRQIKPWFDGQFGFSVYFGNEEVSRDTRVTLTAPAQNFPMLVDAVGVGGGEREAAGGKRLWIWTFHNDTAQKAESNAVFQPNTMAHVAVSTFSSYADAAKIYAARMEGKAAVTPEIQKLADGLTKGITSRREKASALYDWVATHISYVQIVLGAGGFVPNEAGDVLATKYGDCKDHVMLLEAMLKAEGIDSTAVLINAGPEFELPKAASPFNFNHMITYVPAFDLFLDSTSRYAPFGVLPDGDQGKPVVLVKTGDVVTTPRSDTDAMHVVQNIELHDNGAIDGETDVTSTGDAAIRIRALLDAIPKGREADFFRAVLGPGAAGSIDRSDADKLTPDYSFKAHYSVANYASLPGPGAFPARLGFSPMSFAGVIGSDLPEQRTRPYACGNVSADEDVTMSLPKSVEIVSMPKPIDIEAGGIHLRSNTELLAGNRLYRHTDIRASHASETCDAAEYNAARGTLMNMLSGLKAQSLYK